MEQLVLKQKVREYVKEKEANGIKQKTLPWEDAKVNSVGGSTLSVVQDLNPHSNKFKYVAEKIGLEKFKSSLPMHWGTLFEPVIKLYVSMDKSTEVLGDDLFIAGMPGFNYSPDGIGVILILGIMPKYYVVLFEFKCPFSRIPNNQVPKYYVPQVKSGLDTISIAEIGLYCEGVFRRCTWDDLGNNPIYDKTLVSRSSGKNPLAYGFVGFYFDEAEFERILAKAAADILENKVPKFSPAEIKRERARFEAAYADEFETGDEQNNYVISDLGVSTPALFELLMNNFDMGLVQVWYPDIVMAACVENAAVDQLNNDLAAYTLMCSSKKVTALGILPWKLFRIDYHYIEKEPGYLLKWKTQIDEILCVVKQCNSTDDMVERRRIFSLWANSCSTAAKGGFSDE